MFKTKFDHICEPYLAFTSLVGTSLLKDFSFATESLESLVMYVFVFPYFPLEFSSLFCFFSFSFQELSSKSMPGNPGIKKSK
jgi:hypothetical protein